MRKQDSKTAGLYEMRNTTTNRKYYGSSSWIEQRIRVHLSDLKRKVHTNPQIQADYDQGHEFIFEILAVIPDKELRDDWERYYMLGDKNCYNMKGNPNNPPLFCGARAKRVPRKNTPEVLQSMRKTLVCWNCGREGQSQGMKVHHNARCQYPRDSNIGQVTKKRTKPL